ncbi:hypothetical protein DM860_005330 [Cuscuta australis]|uniref:Uncharacterized protein n=1 Tax=Cuscuta australis TaxID=267555 RepID=A0A328DZ05_9ASTE|nr:hypothetical protein DM860_005330 [Cuscuta australis]
MLKYLAGSAGPSGFGSKSTAEEVTEKCPHLRSITAIITGATSGIGAETARVLAKRGARLVLPARDVKVAEETKARILLESPEAEIVVPPPLDLSSLRSVRNFVAHFESLNLPLNLLVNNAGKFAYKYCVSEDGIEMTFATNYLGHFLLTELLLGKMVDTAKATGIVNVSSGTYDWFSDDILAYFRDVTTNPSNYDTTRAYALSKLATFLYTKELAQRLEQKEANVTVNCVHPGVVKTRLNREREGFFTNLVFFLVSKFLKTVSQGASTTCYVATDPRLENVSGKFFVDCNMVSSSKVGINLTKNARLYQDSHMLISSHLCQNNFNPFQTLEFK